MEIYLDNAATTRVSPEAAEAALRMMCEEYGNPGSTHAKGRAARVVLDEARRQVAAPLRCRPGEIVFTSGGTESDNWAIRGAARLQSRKGRHIISSRTEHDAVRRSLEFLENEGWEITSLSPGPDGAVSPESVSAALREDTVLVTLMLVNNETGAVTDIAGVSRALRAAGSSALLHTDAVQAYGKLPFTAKELGADLISLSGHKIHAPKGIGFLYIADKVKVKNLIFGGGQQNGMRSGTENVAGIAAMGLAAQMLYQDFDASIDRLYGLRELFLEQIKDIPDLRVNGPKGKKCAPHIISLTVPGVRAEVLLHALEEKGVYVSSGSACASNRPHTSATLEAIRLPRAYLDNTIRISLSEMTTEEDILQASTALHETIPFLRKYTRH